MAAGDPALVGTTGVANSSTNVHQTAFGQTPTPGNMLIMGMEIYQSSVVTCVTPAGWNAGPAGVAYGASSQDAMTYIFWKIAGVGEVAPALSLSGYGSTVSLIQEWTYLTGLNAASTAKSNATGTSTASNSNPVTTTVAKTFLWTYIGADAAPLRTYTWGGGAVGNFSYMSTGGGSQEAVGTQLATSIGTYTHTVSATSGTPWYASITATLAFAVWINYPPNASVTSSPANGSALDRSIPQRFAWAFSDPNPGDSQSKYDLQYRLGTGAWTTITTTTASNFWDAPASTFPLGTYEWQVRTYDALGLVGAWSASSFFSAADVPSSPTITSPISGGTVGPLQDLVWSAPSQTDYQIRRVKDVAGSADTATVYYDGGSIADAFSRTAPVPYDINLRWEHVQVRIKYSGLWSLWADCRVYVSFVSPMVPILTINPSNASGKVVVTVTNPAPTAGEPVASYNILFRLERGVYEKIAIVIPNGTFEDYAASGDESYFVTTVGNNGAKSNSAISSVTASLHGIWLHDPADPAGTIHQFRWDSGRSTSWAAEISSMEYVGREFPSVEFGTRSKESVDLNLPLDSVNGDVVAMEALVRLRRVLCYRDGRGRKMFGVVDGLPTSDTFYGQDMKFHLDRSDFSEFL